MNNVRIPTCIIARPNEYGTLRANFVWLEAALGPTFQPRSVRSMQSDTAVKHDEK